MFMVGWISKKQILAIYVFIEEYNNPFVYSDEYIVFTCIFCCKYSMTTAADCPAKVYTSQLSNSK